MLLDTYLVFVIIFSRPDYSGYASHYNIGLMEKVSRNRNMQIVECMVSSPYYEIGDWLLITSSHYIQICRKTDTSHPNDKARHIKTRRIIELDFNSAKKLCNISRVGQEKPEKCPIKVTKLVFKKVKDHGYKRSSSNFRNFNGNLTYATE